MGRASHIALAHPLRCKQDVEEFWTPDLGAETPTAMQIERVDQICRQTSRHTVSAMQTDLHAHLHKTYNARL